MKTSVIKGVYFLCHGINFYFFLYLYCFRESANSPNLWPSIKIVIFTKKKKIPLCILKNRPTKRGITMVERDHPSRKFIFFVFVNDL
jgi:hypothetical protein